MNDPVSVFGTDGREYVDLVDRNGNESRQMVAYLVAATFIGPRPENQYVQYKDKNVRNKQYNCTTFGPAPAERAEPTDFLDHFQRHSYK